MSFPSFRCIPIACAFTILIIIAAILALPSYFMFRNNLDDVYLSAEVFQRNYAEMKRKLKIYVYPSNGYHNAFSIKTAGSYAVEDHFSKNLRNSSFVTADPNQCGLFFIPFSFHTMRQKIQSNEQMTSIFGKYVEGLILKYPYWNKTFGLNHFLFTCYGVDMEATQVVPLMVQNSIRVVCSSNYTAGFIPHKDISIPSVVQPFSLPSRGNAMENRTTLAYWAGVCNSNTRKTLVKLWWADKELDIKTRFVLSARVDKLQSAKFCVCPVGSRNSNSCITMAILNGCVPVILEDHIDLPFNSVLDWHKFSVILNEDDVYHLKEILEAKAGADYQTLHTNLIKVQRHFYFHWDRSPVEYDAFHMTMYELWLRSTTMYQSQRVEKEVISPSG